MSPERRARVEARVRATLAEIERPTSAAWLFWLVLAVLVVWIVGLLILMASVSELKARQLSIAREKLTRVMEDSLGEYSRQSWHILEPVRPFVDNWHIDAIADHLQAVSRGFESETPSGHIRRLIINVPPGSMKSRSTCVNWPTWLWGPRNLPHLKILSTSHSMRNATRDAVFSRRLIKSNWYQGRWGSRFALTVDQNVKTKYENDHTGVREIGTPTTSLTGNRADIIIVDDPLDIGDADNDLKLDEVIDWWDGTMQSRVNDPQRSAFVIIMQRLNDRDLCGHVGKRDGFDMLVLPNEYDRKRHCTTSIGFSDPRTADGELLNPARLDAAETARQRLILLDKYEGQYQQQPAASSGRIIQRDSIKSWQALPARFDLEIISVDATFKGEESSDYVVARRWGLVGADKYLCPDGFREHLDFPNTIEALIALRLRCPHVTVILIEDKANGPAIIASLRRKVPGIEAFNPGDRDKMARLRAAAPDFRSGNIYVPPVQDTDGRPIAAYAWVLDTIDEWVRFPKAAHDDEVDSMTQAVIYFNSNENAWANFVKQQVEAAKAITSAPADGHVQTREIVHTGQGDTTATAPAPSAPEPPAVPVAAPDPQGDLSAWKSTFGA